MLPKMINLFEMYLSYLAKADCPTLAEECEIMGGHMSVKAELVSNHYGYPELYSMRFCEVFRNSVFFFLPELRVQVFSYDFQRKTPGRVIQALSPATSRRRLG